MKEKRKIILLLLILDFILIVINIAEWIHEGYLRDLFPQAVVGQGVQIFFLVSLPVTIIIFIAGFILLAGERTATVLKRIVETALCIAVPVLLVCSSYFGYQYYETIKPYGIRLKGDEDYISSEYFRGISLDTFELTLQSKEPSIIYVGRDDCKDCVDFEEAFEKLLLEYDTEIPTYYTTRDRDGQRSEEMYEALEEYGIDGVPTVILVEQSQLIEKWDNPIESLEEIEKYL